MPARPLALHSPGWLDYYDHWFDSRAPGIPTWNRNGRAFPTRREGFEQMQRAGIPTAPSGVVAALARAHPDQQLVVYVDETQHQGLGKELLPAAEAARQHPERLASLYLPPDDGRVVSLRLLRVGARAFAIRYEGGADWRSNHGTEAIDLIDSPLLAAHDGALEALMRQNRSPLLAIDLVPHQGHWYATDLNLAPGMRGTGLSDALPSRQAVEVIKEAFFAYCND